MAALGGLIQQETKLRAREQEMQVLIAAANLKAVAAQQQLAADIRDVEAMNAEFTAVNTRTRAVLREAAKAPDLGEDAVAWWRWSYDQRGYNYVPPPKVYARDAMPAIPAPLVISCFAAGTPVKTRQGPRAIETIQTGDLVLAQDATTGALAFQPVTAVHHNQPAATVRLRLDNGEEIVPSTYHRFWLAGRGWVMARDLKPGDPLRALSGRIKVAQVGPGETVPVFNLDIASHHTYFVGDHDYLVHDNTYPSTSTVVFDLPPGPEPHRPPL